MTIRFRLITVAGVPFLLLLASSYWHVQSTLTTYQVVADMQQNARLFAAASDLISQVQKERGLSVLFTAKGTSRDAVDQQRCQTDTEIPLFVAAMEHATIPKDAKQNGTAIRERLAGLRKEVDGGLDASRIKSQYTSLIDSLLNIEGAVAAAKTTKGVGKRLSALVILETAKERAGLFRAGMSRVLACDTALDNASLAELLRLKGEIDANLASPALVLSAESGELLEKHRKSDAWQEVDRVFTLVLHKVQTGGFAVQGSEFFETATIQVDDIGAVVSDELTRLNADMNDMLRQMGRDVLIAIAMSVTTLLMCGAMASYQIGSISRNINRVTDSLEDIGEGEGDLTKRLDFRSNDELGRLARHFNGFADKIQNLIRQVAHGIETISQSSGQILTAATDMAREAEQTNARCSTVASAAEEVSINMNNTAASTEQMTTNVKTVASAVEEMTASISEIAKNAEQASIVAGNATELAQTSNQSISQLGTAADEIGKVIETIQDIAEQTNLLALNATIEAARAGDAGKGFAVVATEVKELAKQTADATEGIRRRIEGIQSSTAEAVMSIGQIGEVIQQVNDVSRTIASAVEEQSITTKEIAGNITQTSDGTAVISTGVAESASATQEITRNISGVYQASQQTIQGALQTQAAGTELSKLAGELQTLLGQFKV